MLDWFKKNLWWLMLLSLALVFIGGMVAGYNIGKPNDTGDSQALLAARNTIEGLQRGLDESRERNRNLTAAVERDQRERQTEIQRAIDSTRSAEAGIRDASDGIDKALEIAGAIRKLAEAGRE